LLYCFDVASVSSGQPPTNSSQVIANQPPTNTSKELCGKATINLNVCYTIKSLTNNKQLFILGLQKLQLEDMLLPF